MDEFPGGIMRAWSWPWLPALSILLTGAVYFRGWLAARRTRPEELPGWRAACFFTGLGMLWIALASPIDALDDDLLAAHMLQHFILMSVVPPLVVLGAPAVPLLRGLPRRLIGGVLRPILTRRWAAHVLHALRHPTLWWLAMNVAYLGWHVPAAFELSLHSDNWHNCEHMCFLFTSIGFWWVVLSPWPSVPRWPRWFVIPYLFSGDLVNTMLSATLAFCGRVLYPSYALAPRVSGLSPLQDQILAGSEMWVLNSIVFLVPAVVVTVQLLAPKNLRGRFVES